VGACAHLVGTFVPVRRGTRVGRMGRIGTNPCQSVASVSSVFYLYAGRRNFIDKAWPRRPTYALVPPISSSPKPKTMPEKTAERPSEHLERGLGLLDATMIVVGSMIGSGIFITSADEAAPGEGVAGGAER
jgi:hypothetical protein